MSDYTDDVIAGLFCECCGVVIDEDAPGYPRRCEDCKRTAGEED